MLFFRVRQNNRFFRALVQSMVLLFFTVSLQNISHWCIDFCTGSQCRRYGGAQGRRTPPSFRFFQNTFLEHHVTTRQQAIMEKGIIIFRA